MAANYWGDYGLNAVLDDSNPVYVQDDTPTAEKSFHARFYVNSDGVAISAGGFIYILQGFSSNEYFHILLQKSGTTSQIVAGVRASNGTWSSGSWVNLNSGWNSVEIGWEAKELFGTLSLWVNGTQVTSLTNIDNQADSLESIRLGMIAASGTISGQLAIDDYESRRYSYIGMMPDRGVPDPEATQEPGWAEKVYTYSNSHAHAVETVSLPSGQNTYQYDANGNMTQRVENGVTWTQTYNSENRLATMSNGTTTWLFSYDGDGTRVGQLVTNGTGAIATSYFAGGAYEVTVNGSTQTVRKYYSLAGSTFAMNDNGVMKYLLSDHLGSTVVVTDAAGTLLEESRYMPFGEVRGDVGGVTSTDKTYTGQKSIPETGLMDYKARMYDPLLGRFVQPDTIVPFYNNSQSWNRYIYVNNDPISLTDPSGNMYDNGCRTLGCSGSENYDYVYNVLHNNNERRINTIIVENTADAIETGVRILSTPIDTIMSVKDCAIGKCSPLLLVGILIPILPGNKVVDLANTIKESKYVKELITVGTNSSRIEKEVETTGQLHHILSKKIVRALEQHEILSGILSRDDFIVQGADKASHSGYQKWHRIYDDLTVNWLGENAKASSGQFLNFLLNVYQDPKMQQRFPDGWKLLQMALEEIE